MTIKNCHPTTELNTAKIAFIGVGNMAQAIVHGLMSSGIEPSNLHCSNPSSGKLNDLLKLYPDINIYHDNADAAKQADIVILAVKPQKMSLALNSLDTIKFDHKLVISIAAGVEISSILNGLNHAKAVMRAMPNTPAMIGEGATGLFANEQTTDSQQKQASYIFNSVGKSIWLEQESQMNLVTAISGSGPAHYFYFLEAVIKSAEAQGMNHETAKALAVQTALGAAKMVQENKDVTINELRTKVTSPGGTTAAAIESFQNDQFIEIINKALQNSVKRGIELAELSKQTTEK